jgi:uncharacterized protein YciI
VDLDAYQLVLLRRPASAPDLPDDRLQELQRAHVAFYGSMREAGHVVTNGPVHNPPDETLRGIAIYRAESESDALALARSDPSVRAGRLTVDVMTWWAPRGTLTRPGRAIEIDDP